MRFAAFGQKFEVVSESHWFLSYFFILYGVIALNACRYIYVLDSIAHLRHAHLRHAQRIDQRDEETDRSNDRINQERDFRSWLAVLANRVQSNWP